MMEIILLEKIRNLGDLGETVRVANGYARNYLIPQKKAMRATADALVEVEKRRRELAVQEGKRVEAAQAKADLLAREIVLSRLVNESGALYGSVSPADIAEALSGEHAQVEKSEIAQAQPIKHPGEYQVEVILHAEVRLSVTIQVIGEGAPVVDGEVIADDAAVVDAVTYESSAPAEVHRETPPMVQPAAVKPEVRHEDKREVTPQPKPEVQAETPSVETIAPADVVVKEDDTPPVAPVVEPETPPVVVAESKPVEIKKEEVAKKSVDTPPVAPVVEPQTPPVVAAESKPTETKKKAVVKKSVDTPSVAPVVEPQTPPVVAAESKPTETKKKVVAKKAVAKKTAKKTVAKKAVAKKATAKKAVSKTTAKKVTKKAAKKVAKKTAKKAAKKAAAK